MKIVFIQKWNLEYPSIMSLCAFLKKKGFKAEVIIDSRDTLRKLNLKKPDIIGITCLSSEIKWTVGLANKIKSNMEVPIIVGGIHPTISLDVLKNKNIDYVCRGDGEESIYKLMNKLKKNNKKPITNIKGISTKANNVIYDNGLSNPIKDLDSLPFPDREVYNLNPRIKDSSYACFMVSRGCNHECSFCYSQILKKESNSYSARYKSPRYVIDEIMNTISKSNIKTIHFYDSNFPMVPYWVEEFSNLYYQNVRIPFTINLRADYVKLESLKKLKKSGLTGISMGIEMGNEEKRANILKKKIKNKSFISASRIIRKLGLKLMVSNILAVPGNSIKDEIDSIKFCQLLKPDYILNGFLHPFPGLEITEFAKKKGLLTKKDLEGFCSKDPEPCIKVKDIKEYKKIFYLFFFLVKFKISKKMIKLLLKNLPLEICKLFGFYNQYSYLKFHRLKLKELKYHFGR